MLILIWPTGLKDIEVGIYTPAHMDTHRARVLISVGKRLKPIGGFGTDLVGDLCQMEEKPNI